jgi:type II secretory pathway component GspD/PulD (secretin)
VPAFGFEREDHTSKVLIEPNPRASAAGEEGAEGDRVVAITPPASFTRKDLGRDEEGLRVVITPTIGTEMITAAVSIAANTVTGFDELDMPIVSEQDYETVVTLQDRRPLHLGTIERSVVVNYRRGLPLLRDIPILKPLFSVRGKRAERSSLYIVATPCFCNQAVYRKLRTTEEGAALKIDEIELPRYIERRMLPEVPEAD